MHAISLGSLPTSDAQGVTSTRAAIKRHTQSLHNLLYDLLVRPFNRTQKAQDSGVSPRVPTMARRRCTDSAKRDAETAEPRRSTAAWGCCGGPAPLHRSGRRWRHGRDLMAAAAARSLLRRSTMELAARRGSEVVAGTTSSAR
jgi:hypothetical protein